MNKLTLFFVFFGIVFLSIMIHEGIHLLQAKEPTAVCLAVGSPARMYVEAAPHGEKNMELYAYSGQAISAILLMIVVLKHGG